MPTHRPTSARTSLPPLVVTKPPDAPLSITITIRESASIPPHVEAARRWLAAKLRAAMAPHRPPVTESLPPPPTADPTP
jgi:hypothetical protein